MDAVSLHFDSGARQTSTDPGPSNALAFGWLMRPNGKRQKDLATAENQPQILSPLTANSSFYFVTDDKLIFASEQEWMESLCTRFPDRRISHFAHTRGV